MSDTPVVEQIKKVSAIAGQTQFNAKVRYPGEPSEIHGFVGMVGEYGPVVAISPAGHQIFVTDPGRFGPFGKEWVERFYDPDPLAYA
jgi:hypothetical protein